MEPGNPTNSHVQCRNVDRHAQGGDGDDGGVAVIFRQEIAEIARNNSEASAAIRNGSFNDEVQGNEREINVHSPY